VDLSRPGVAKRFEAWRKRLNAGEVGIGAMLEEEGLRLATDRLHYVSHWVTPEGPPRRFNARFFLTVLPGGQEAMHHELEVDESCWIAPGQALEAWSENRLPMIPPTVMSLQSLADFQSLEEALAAYPRP
jgi:hypothetical protein